MAEPHHKTKHEPEPPVARSELACIFLDAEKPKERFRIGVEEEKFGVHAETGRPLDYDGAFGVRVVMEDLAQRHGWQCVREQENGPPIALSRGSQSITLEPGAQLELSGAPLVNLHEVLAERDEHHRELEPISQALGIRWLSTGFHPFSRLDELPWVPKERYPIMRAYLPTRGAAAHDMMQRTATVQANYDYSSEVDAMKKLVVSLRLSPILHALFANGPFKEGREATRLSERGNVWLHMDPSRSGLIPSVWNKAVGGKSLPSYDDYIEWALDAGMFLIWREGVPIKNTGQTFRDFLQNGYQGHRATLSDWRLHLATLFPEARLKSTLEVRPLDALPRALSIAAVGVWTGILYDDVALEASLELTRNLGHDELNQARPELVARGLDAPVPGFASGWELGAQLLGIARAGLERRAATLGSASEAPYLDAAFDLVHERTCPARLARARAASFGDGTKRSIALATGAAG